ncbi:hypothetical protein HK102_012652, partial [Quaeritorhiza haematococci]
MPSIATNTTSEQSAAAGFANQRQARHLQRRQGSETALYVSIGMPPFCNTSIKSQDSTAPTSTQNATPANTGSTGGPDIDEHVAVTSSFSTYSIDGAQTNDHEAAASLSGVNVVNNTASSMPSTDEVGARSNASAAAADLARADDTTNLVRALSSSLNTQQRSGIEHTTLEEQEGSVSGERIVLASFNAPSSSEPSIGSASVSLQVNEQAASKHLAEADAVVGITSTAHPMMGDLLPTSFRGAASATPMSPAIVATVPQPTPSSATTASDSMATSPPSIPATLATASPAAPPSPSPVPNTNAVSKDSTPSTETNNGARISCKDAWDDEGK